MSLLFVYGNNRFSHDVAQMVKNANATQRGELHTKFVVDKLMNIFANIKIYLSKDLHRKCKHLPLQFARKTLIPTFVYSLMI